MIIGIDISQLAYPNTGVANYLSNLVKGMVKQDSSNKYVLFFSSLRGKLDTGFEAEVTKNKNGTIKKFPIPQSALVYMWNKAHKFPIENFIGNIDVFITSDWTEPPSRAKKATILYDTVVYNFPEETDENITKVQKMKHKWMKKESSAFLCISKSTATDAHKLLGIPKDKLHVIYPGI